MITVYVGDVTEYLGVQARQSDSTARLIDSSNYSALTDGTYYTSIGDMATLDKFAQVLRQADRIVYAPPVEWSDRVMQSWTEDYLSVFVNKIPVDNFTAPVAKDKSVMLDLVDQRKTDQPQLWVAGCSFTYGTGVEPDQRYGQLLADRLGLAVSFLARPGSSITWQADQILRSDICADDIVVWGLTSHERFPYYKNSTVTHVTPLTYEQDPSFKRRVDIGFLDSEQLVYQAVVEIHQVINFCHKVGAELVLAQLLGKGLEQYLHGYPNYQMLTGQFGRNYNNILLDLGTDNQHPGPKMHEWYTEQILTKLNKDTK